MARTSNLQEKIIEATIQEISQNGIENLTTKNISQRAETSTGIIHHHFNTKDDLVLATYAELVSGLEARRQEVRAQYPDDPVTRIKQAAMVGFTYDFANDDSARAWTQLWASAMCNPQVGDVLKKYSHSMLKVFEDDFKEFCTPEVARQHALSVVAMINGYWIELQVAKSTSVEECGHAINCCVDNARRDSV